MENNSTKEVCKKYLGRTMGFLTRRTKEQREAKEKSKLMERIMGHTGLPKGVIHSLDKLTSYCNKNNIDFTPIELEDKSDISVLAKLGKGSYQLIYDRKGNYKGMATNFLVKTESNRLLM